MGPARPAARADPARLCRCRRPGPADRGSARLRLAPVPRGRHRAGLRAGLRPPDAGRGGAGLVLRPCDGDHRPRLARAGRLRPPRRHRPGDDHSDRDSGRARAALGTPAADADPAGRRRPLHGRLPDRQPGRFDPGDRHAPCRRSPSRRGAGAELGHLVGRRPHRHADRRADRPHPDRPAALGMGAAPDSGRPHPGRGHRLPRRGDRPDGALERRAGALGVQPRRLERRADPDDPAAGAVAGARGAARGVRLQPAAEPRRDACGDRALARQRRGPGDGLERAGAPGRHRRLRSAGPGRRQPDLPRIRPAGRRHRFGADRDRPAGAADPGRKRRRHRDPAYRADRKQCDRPGRQCDVGAGGPGGDPGGGRDRPAGRHLRLSPDAAEQQRPADGRRRLPGDLRPRGHHPGRPARRLPRRRLRLPGHGRPVGDPGRQGAGLSPALHHRRRPPVDPATGGRPARLRRRARPAWRTSGRTPSPVGSGTCE